MKPARLTPVRQCTAMYRRRFRSCFQKAAHASLKRRHVSSGGAGSLNGSVVAASGTHGSERYSTSQSSHSAAS